MKRLTEPRDAGCCFINLTTLAKLINVWCSPTTRAKFRVATTSADSIQRSAHFIMPSAMVAFAAGAAATVAAYLLYKKAKKPKSIKVTYFNIQAAPERRSASRWC